MYTKIDGTFEYRERSVLSKHLPNANLTNYEVIKELTYKDWKNDKIPVPCYFSEDGMQLVCLDGRDIHEIWSGKHFDVVPKVMSKEEVDKIKKEQIRIYSLTVKMFVDGLTFSLKNSINGLTRIEKIELIDNEIVIHEERIDKKLKNDVLKGFIDEKIITPRVRKFTLKLFNYGPEDEWIIADMVIKNIKVEGLFNWMPYEGLFKGHVEYRYLKKLKEMKETILDPDTEKKPSNSAELHEARAWMDPLARKIGKLTFPVEEEEILELLEEVYPDFRSEFDFDELKTPLNLKKKLNKTSISKALNFILQKKHPDLRRMKYDTIRTKYSQTLDYWPNRK